jgi:hypothetical protein
MVMMENDISMIMMNNDISMIMMEIDNSMMIEARVAYAEYDER